MEAINAAKPVGPRYTHQLSGEVWLKVVFMRDLQPKSYTSDIETRRQNLKNIAVAEGSLFSEGLESNTMMSVCRQQ